MEDLLKKLNLAKGSVVEIAKESGIGDQKSDVIFVLDYSGSMGPLYESGYVQHVLQRIVPISMGMDEDGAMPLYIFNDDAWRVQPDVTQDNVAGYVDKYIKAKYSMGGTSYTPAIDLVLSKFIKDYAAGVNKEEKEISVLGKIGNFFSSKKAESKTPDSKQVTAKKPVYVIFLTDGENDNSDKPLCVRAITEASKHGIFFQFVGLKGKYSSLDFKFLKKLDEMQGRFIDNANFFEITSDDLLTSDNKSLYSKMLAEYPSWVKEAGVKKLIELPASTTATT